MAKIEKAWAEIIQSAITSAPSPWRKGDWIPRERVIYAKVAGQLVELSKEALRSTFNWKNITDDRLASLVGKEAGNLIKEVLK